MKAQLVKNAVIVPTGAKGGFYPKQLPPRRRPRRLARRRHRELPDLHPLPALGHRQYRRAARSSIRTRSSIRDGDDPYFVVAADKGTATFSDVANAIAIERGFWLGDAFASGRLQRLRPQGDGDHRQGRLGLGPAPLPRAGRRRPEASRSGSPASATCRATCSATACCCPRRSSWSPPSTTATSSSIPIPIRRRAGRSASGCSTCRARPGPITTRR